MINFIFLEEKTDKEGQFKLDNSSLLKTKKDIIQFVSFKLNDNVMILPPRVWSAFVSWYGKT